MPQKDNAMTNPGILSSGSSEVRKVACEVERLIELESAELDEAFFPAHLSIALIDAVFNPQLDYYGRVVPIIERYCRQFGALPDKKRQGESSPD